MLDPAAPFPCGLDDDQDGYGNLCDGDFDNDGATDLNDVAPFAAQLGQGSPGPSGLFCAGSVPCP